MDETPEIEAKRDRPLFRALLRTEILITLPTLVISIALAYFSFVQADASRKMQRTETWPYVSYGTDNSSPQVKDEISFNLSNDGVGPARLEEMEFLYNGKPMRDRGYVLDVREGPVLAPTRAPCVSATNGATGAGIARYMESWIMAQLD